MKTPQRRFVVEFKSGRRLSKTQATSIWGGTDLKAIAREVEDQSSHLLGAAKTAVQVTEPMPHTSALISVGEPVVKDVAPEPLIDTVVVSADSPGSTPAVLAEIAEPAPTPMEAPAASKTVKAPRKRVARAAPAPIPAATVEQLQMPTSSGATASACLDDLAALDAENKRLRQLLANQLRAQNAELKRMLERF
ncbi:hypothetical protein C6558_35440 [Ensifer sp. NM-2]|uniref:hypothetical protein n=1 Tax=Ensifer sp. NM-2 TaxID=2109730 RepID=UPI000D46FCF0|nr:hypothetical protein [Ensifer sp. NM-2]PSS59986.1 hypothetical protein C6558_35440 [Ensifer sp. NM-2]